MSLGVYTRRENVFTIEELFFLSALEHTDVVLSLPSLQAFSGMLKMSVLTWKT